MRTTVRAIKRKDGTYTLMDIDGEKSKPLTAKQVKSIIMSRKLDIIDMQIDKAGRLVSKKVDLRKVCKPNRNEPISWEEQEDILLSGLARINQMSNKAKQGLALRIKSIHSELDEDDLLSMIIDNQNWSIKRYEYTDTMFRDRVMGVCFYLAWGEKFSKMGLFWF